MGAIIADFGKNAEGVNLFRINGSKDEIKKAIHRLKEIGCEVWEPYEYEIAHKHLSVLIRVQVPEFEDKKEKPNE